MGRNVLLLLLLQCWIFFNDLLQSPGPSFGFHCSPAVDIHLPFSAHSFSYCWRRYISSRPCARQTDRQTDRQTHRQAHRQTDTRETPPHSFRQPGDVSASQPVCSVTLRGCSGTSSCILLTVRQAFPVLRRPRASEDGRYAATRQVFTLLKQKRWSSPFFLFQMNVVDFSMWCFGFNSLFC